MIKKALVLTLLWVLAAACALQKKKAVESVPPDYNIYLSQGNEFLRQKQFDRAVEVLVKAIGLRPDAARAYNLLGVAHFMQENLQQAEENFQKAASLDKSYDAAFNNLGNVYFLMGQTDKAEDYFKKALSISPHSVSANYSLGTLLLSQGQYEEGMAYLSRGISLDPDYLEKHKDFQASIAVSGLNSPETFFAWAKAYAAQGFVDKTVEYLDKARRAGFRDWKRLETDKEFEKIIDNPEIKKFLREEE